MTHEQLAEAFSQLYPAEFKHVVAELRVKELEAELAEARKEPEDSTTP